jgi:hypothetical protein
MNAPNRNWRLGLSGFVMIIGGWLSAAGLVNE